MATKIVVEATPETLLVPITGQKVRRARRRDGDIGPCRAFIGEHMCGGSIKLDAMLEISRIGQSEGTIISDGRTYLLGAEMTKGSITIKGMAKMLPSYQRIELVKIEGANFQKHVGDLVKNGKGEIYVFNPAQQSP